jgi:hypothetical protein
MQNTSQTVNHNFEQLVAEVMRFENQKTKFRI